jgi:hypothetical protein
VRRGRSGRFQLAIAAGSGEAARRGRQFSTMTGAICEVAQMLGARPTAPEPVVAALTAVYEEWDGKGLPGGLAGEAIPFTVR